MMLEVGQPGEVPLIRELSALKKNRGLRDPSTTTSSRRSPVLEAVSGELIEGGYEEAGMRKQHRQRGSGGPDGIRGSKGSLTRSSQLASTPGADADPRLSRDFPREALKDLDASPTNFHKQREELRCHLEKLGMLGENSDFGMHTLGGGKSLLHNWRPAHSNEDEGEDEEGNGPFIAAERFEEQASPDMQSWPDATREEPTAQHGYSAIYRDKDLGREGRVKASQKASRMAMVDRVLRQNAQILSPLALNSHYDLRKFSQSKSLFTLEEACGDDEEEQYLDEETESDFTSTRITTSSNRAFQSSHSPLGPPQARRASRKYPSNMNSRSADMFGDMDSDMGRGSSRAGPWEHEFLDYEVAPVEDNSMPNYRPKNRKLPRHHSTGQEAISQCLESRKMGRRKGGGLDRYSILHSSSYTKRNPRIEVEPLPFLTELEDYNETSSVDGNGGGPSERELEAFTSSDGRSLVRVEDKGNLQLACPESKELALCEYKPRNLSQKYRPRAFEEVVGQSIVTQALSNAILKGKIAPVYLFQGSRGTGKTSAARIFAAALICTSPEGLRPCGACRECISVATGQCSEVKEVDAASNNGIERVKILLEETITAPPLSRYKVFIIDECHVLTTETWNALLKILEEPPMNVVFILITTDPDRLPQTALSRCQKFPFPKIKESEIVNRLQQLASLENLEVHAETLQLIASRSDGSLRDAETILDQLSLLGQEISSSTVYELVGSASDERMLSLLDSALQADTVGTVQRARKLVDSGVEPLSLMSHLATLITDIIAGSFKFTESQRKGFFREHTLSEEKLEWLRMAMKTLSEAEKQLRVSNDRATWLTAALLQLGPDRSCMFPASYAGTSVTQSPAALDDMGDNEAPSYEGTSSGQQMLDDEANQSGYDGSNWGMKRSNELPTTKIHQDRSIASAHPAPPPPPEKQSYDEDRSDDYLKITNSGQTLSSSKLDEIWSRVVVRCQPPALRQLLHVHGNLLSISMSEVDAVVHLEVSHPEHKSTFERAQKSIAGVFKSVLGFPVEVKMSLASLPLEKEDTKDWIPAGNVHMEEGSNERRDVVPSENLPKRAYSLSHWKHEGSSLNNMGAPQPNPLECFPAIPQTSFGPPMKEGQYPHPWNSNMCSAYTEQPHSSNNMQDRQQQVRAHETLDMNLDEARRGHFPHIADKGIVYGRGLEYDDAGSAYSDGERLDLQSPGPHDVAASGNVNRPRHGEGARDSDTHCSDGRRSCDTTNVEKSKGSTLKMVRRLTMRSHTRSLPSSNPNSPDERGSSRFATVKKHMVRSQKNLSGDEEATSDIAEASNNYSQKKSILRGAAGSFARFFKGSK